MTSEYESKEIKLTVDAAGIASDTSTGEVNENSFWFKTRRWIRSVGAEELGIERIPEEMRTNQNPRDLFTVFFSVSIFLFWQFDHRPISNGSSILTIEKLLTICRPIVTLLRSPWVFLVLRSSDLGGGTLSAASFSSTYSVQFSQHSLPALARNWD